MSKIIATLKIDVKPSYLAPKGHKQGNLYGKAGSFEDKRSANRSNEKVKFKKTLED